MSRIRDLPPLAGLLLLAACSVPLPYTARPVDLDAAREAFGARSLDAAGLKDFMSAAGTALPAPGEPWNLDQLTLAAEWFSPELAQAQAQWTASLARRAVAVPLLVPAIDPSVEHHSLTDSYHDSPWTFGLGLELVLPDPARRAARKALASGEVDAAQAELAGAYWSVRRRVRAAWIELQSATAQLALAESSERLQQQRLAALSASAHAGLAGPGELGAGRLAAARADLLVDDARRARDLARAGLRQALALPPVYPEQLPLALEIPAIARAPATLDRQALATQALHDRIDLALAAARLRQADAEVRLQVAEQYPELGLRPGYEWDQGDHRLRLGISLPLNLPAARRAPIEAAVAEREVRARELLAIQERVLQEVDEAWEAWSAEQSRTPALQQLVLDAEAQARRSEAAVRHGESEPVQAIEAGLLGEEAKSALLDHARRLALAEGLLEDALQRPLPGILPALAKAADLSPATPGSIGGAR